MGSKGSMFRYADGVDKLLVLFGTLGSIGDGMMSPLTMIVLSGAINDYAGADLSLSIQVVDKVYALKLSLLVMTSLQVCHWIARTHLCMCNANTLKSVLRQDVGFFDNQSDTSTSFQVVSTISYDAHAIQDVIADKIPNCLTHLSAFTFSIVAAFMLSWRLALASLPFSLMFIIPGVGFGKVLMELGKKMKDAYATAGGIAEQAISSIRTVYSYAGEHQTLDRFSHSLQKSMEFGIKQGFTKGLMIGSMGMIFATWAFMAWVGSVLVTERGEKGGPVFVSSVCVILGGISIMSALPNLSFFSEATAAATRIFEMINQTPIIDSEDKKGKILSYVRGDIDFKEVDFSYPSRPGTPILQEFSLKVQAGLTVGLVGGSGSGKSTVISLFQRFYDPIRGDIFLDGYKIKRLQLKWLRSQMGLVNQEPVLFATSIKENILFGKEGASMELVVSAAMAANAHNFIVELPEGYETQVGQFGVQLSGGQKQRIAIARALIREPRILLLDEATSALDAQSERVVQEALDQASQGRTTIIIAHRLTTIRNADLIVVLQSGTVVESGSHSELIQLNNGEGGAYFKMVQLQQSAMQTEVTNGSHQVIQGIDQRKIVSSQTPRTPRTPRTPNSYRSSWQSNPVYPFSPALSISIAPSYNAYDDSVDETLTKSSYSPPSQWRLLQMNAPEWKRALLGCLGALGFGAIQPIHSYCLGTIVSVYFLEDTSNIKSETKMYCFIFLSLAVLSFIFNLLQHYNFAIMGQRLTKRVREKMLGKVLTFEVGWFDRDDNTSAAICARLASDASMVRSLIGERMSLLVQVFTGASLAFVIGLVVTWRVASVMIAMQPLIIGSFYSRSVLMKSLSEKTKKAQTEGSQLASEATTNHRTITAFSSQERILSLFKTTMRGPRKENIKQSWFSGFGLFSSQFLTTAVISLTYWYGGRLMNKGLVTPKQLFQVFFILMSTGRNIAEAGSMTSDIAKSSSAVTSVFEILDRKTEIEPEDPEGISIEKAIKGHIELKKVSFYYPSRPEQMIFKGLNLKIEAGKTVALVGQSGSGKSTVIGLIERFYDPISGSIHIDQKDIKSYNLRHLRSHIALVSQEPTLFAGSIRENIVYGKEGATESELRKAANLANAHEFIRHDSISFCPYCIRHVAKEESSYQAARNKG